MGCKRTIARTDKDAKRDKARAGKDAPPLLKLLKRLRNEAKRKPRFRFASRRMPRKALFEVPTGLRGTSAWAGLCSTRGRYSIDMPD
jgi:hypothetical protein